MKYFAIIFIILYSYFGFSQNKETVYIKFNADSKETFEKENDIGEIVKEKKYIKTFYKDKNENLNSIKFYIGKELFELDKKNKIDTCSVGFLQNKKISNIKSLKEIVNKGDSFYPWKNFKKVYLIENFNQDQIILYDAKWVYYIE